MLILYNILQVVLLILLFPIICIYIASKAKYRDHIPRRLGLGLRSKPTGIATKEKTIWIHALSVGEVTSAIPLVKEISNNLSNVSIIFSASTSSGYNLAIDQLKDICDRVIAYPLDLLPTVNYFIKNIKPDLFILVETDFWPNFLSRLAGSSIPAILVNGRISSHSIAQYKRFAFFFRLMFSSFSHICIQTDSDRKRLLALGVANDRILKLGNLKYEAVPPKNAKTAKLILQNVHAPIFIAGSTHQGEEEIILDVFTDLKKNHAVKLIIAPRDIKRADEIEKLARTKGVEAQYRTTGNSFVKDLLILDTIGELTAFYGESTICYVGGSLVAEGGHNPLEPASQGKPVIFGPYMTDFKEISADLLHSGGGFCVSGKEELYTVAVRLLKDTQYRENSGDSAKSSIAMRQGSLDTHLRLIEEML